MTQNTDEHNSHPVVVNTAEFMRELEWVTRFIEHKISIPILSNVSLRTSGGILSMASTDLEIAGATLVDCSGDGVFGIAVPPRRLLKYLGMVELISTGEDAFHFGSDENHLFFLSQSSMRRILARKLTGNFPDYERVIPKGFPHQCQMSSTALIRAVERVMLFADERSLACMFELTKGVMEVSASVTESGKASNRIPATWGGEPFLIGLNAKYIQQFLKAIPPNGDFDYKFKDPTSASMLSVPAWDYLVMPLRT